MRCSRPQKKMNQENYRKKLFGSLLHSFSHFYPFHRMMAHQNRIRVNHYIRHFRTGIPESPGFFRTWPSPIIVVIIIVLLTRFIWRPLPSHPYTGVTGVTGMSLYYRSVGALRHPKSAVGFFVKDAEVCATDNSLSVWSPPHSHPHSFVRWTRQIIACVHYNLQRNPSLIRDAFNFATKMSEGTEILEMTPQRTMTPSGNAD